MEKQLNPTDAGKDLGGNRLAEHLTDDRGGVIQYDQMPDRPGTQKLVVPKEGESPMAAIDRVKSDPRVEEVVVTDSGLVLGRRVPMDLAKDLKERALTDLLMSKATRDLARLIVLSEVVEGQRAAAQGVQEAVHELILDTLARVDGYGEYLARVNNKMAHAITGNTDKANLLYQRQIEKGEPLPAYSYARIAEARWEAKLTLGDTCWTAMARSKRLARGACAAQALEDSVPVDTRPAVPVEESSAMDDSILDLFAAVLAARHNKDMHALNGNTAMERSLQMALERESRDDSGVAKGEKLVAAATADGKQTTSDSPLVSILRQIGQPGTTSIGTSLRADSMIAFSTTSDTKITVREQDHEHFLNITGGHHVLPRNFRDNTPATIAWAPHSLMVRPISWKEPTVPVTLLPLYTTAMTVVDGADPGAVSSPLRMNLTTIVGNLNLMHAQLIGDNIRKGIGTSTADVALRCLMAMFSHSLLDNGGELIVSNYTWRADNPVAITHDATANWFPMSPGAVAAGPLPAGTVRGVVASLDMFMQVATGTAAPVAGFETTAWGSSGASGVAIVPIRSSWLLDGAVNCAWACAFMEYPTVLYNTAGRIIDVTGADILNPCPAITATQAVRVPGPFGRIIFVLTDVENQTPAAVRVGRGAWTTLTAAVNSLVGGAAADLSPSFSNYWTAAGASAAIHDEAFLALTRWNQLFGSEQDWWSAWLTAVDVYARYNVRPRRRLATGELLFWNSEVAAPFVDNGLGYAAPTAAQIAQFDSLLTSASGVRGGAAFGLATAETHTIAGNVPLGMIGLAARFYRCSTPLTLDINVGTAELAMRAARDADTMAAAFDWLAQRLQIQERVVLALGSLANQGDARMWWYRMRDQWWTLTKSLNALNTYKPLWTWNETANAGYMALCPNTQDTMALSRVSQHHLARRGLDVLPHDDFISAVPFGYKYRRLNPGAGVADFDVLERCGLKEFLVAPELHALLRQLLTTGGFTTALVDITPIALCDETGGWARYASLPFEHPTAGLSWELEFSNFRAAPHASDICEVLHSAGVALLDTETGNRLMRVALSGARAVTAGSGRFLPIMVTRGTLRMVTGAPVRDTTSASPADLPSELIFRV